MATGRSKGAARDIWNSSDQFNYAYKSLSGDGIAIAQVTSIGYTDQWAKGGVMFSQLYRPRMLNSSISWSRRAKASVFSGAIVRAFQTTSKSLASSRRNGVKLVRVGDTFTGYYSSDGNTWISIGRRPPWLWGTNALAGLAVTAHDDGALTTATFSNVSIGPPPPVGCFTGLERKQHQTFPGPG